MEGETVIAGVDTHKDVHVLCLLDGLGRKIRSGSFGADPEGYDRLAEAIGDPGSCMVVGVEGTASYGAGLTRRLVELGYNVVEVLRPKRDKARPGEGKSDPLDAERAARKAASGKGCSVPKSQDGWVEAVRQLYVARRLAVATSTSCVACAKSMLTTAPGALRERFRGRERPKDLMPLLARGRKAGDALEESVLASLRSVAALAEGEVKTDDYFFMDVIFGKQCSVEMGRGTSGVEFRVFPEGLRRALGEFTASGRSLFVSGSFIATDPWRSPASTDEERAFVKSVLRYDYRGGQASRRGEARIVASPARMDRERFYFNTEPCRDFYPVEAPDALRPVGGGFTVMRYDDGDQTAAVGYTGDYRSLAMGFPFEAIVDEGQRDRLMQQIMNFLEPRK